MKKLVVITDRATHRPHPCTWYIVEEKERTRTVDQYGRPLSRPEKYRPLVATLTLIPNCGLSRSDMEDYADSMAAAGEMREALQRLCNLWDDQYCHMADEEERAEWDRALACLGRASCSVRCGPDCSYFSLAPYGSMTKHWCSLLKRQDPSPGGRIPPKDCPRLVPENVETPLGEALDGHGDEVES